MHKILKINHQIIATFMVFFLLTNRTMIINHLASGNFALFKTTSCKLQPKNFLECKCLSICCNDVVPWLNKMKGKIFVLYCVCASEQKRRVKGGHRASTKGTIAALYEAIETTDDLKLSCNIAESQLRKT